MTNEEALNICRLAKKAIAVKHDPNNDANDVESMMRKMQEQIAENADLNFMIAAIEKQIPLYPVNLLSEYDGKIRPSCPRCRESFAGMNYCDWCGQRLERETKK